MMQAPTPTQFQIFFLFQIFSAEQQHQSYSQSKINNIKLFWL
jgi:hypothetical protein